MSIRADLLRLGVFLLVAAVVAALLVASLGRFRFGVPEQDYTARFTDVTALAAGDAVRVAGVRVGQVTYVGLADGTQARVGFAVEDAQPVLADTSVAVRYDNLVGDRYLELIDGPGPAAPQPPEEEIGLDRTVPPLDLDVLLNGFRPLLKGLAPEQMNALATSLVDTLQGRGGSVASLVEHTASLTGTLADRDEAIGALITDLGAVLATVDENGERLGGTIDGLQQLVGGLAEERETVGSTISELQVYTAEFGSLLADARPPLQGTIAELDRAATALDEDREELRRVIGIELPDALRRLGRVGSYGSFFNFYLCSAQVTVTGPDGEPLSTPPVDSNALAERCHG